MPAAGRLGSRPCPGARLMRPFVETDGSCPGGDQGERRQGSAWRSGFVSWGAPLSLCRGPNPSSWSSPIRLTRRIRGPGS
jgi:hypothetical protein